MSIRHITFYPGTRGQPLHGVERIEGKAGRYITYCGRLCPRHWVPEKRHVAPVLGMVLECQDCNLALIESERIAREEERRMYE